MERTRTNIPTKKYTKEEKINWVFKYLVLRLQPEICYTSKGNYSTGIRGQRTNVSYYVCDVNIDNLPEDIPYPFEGVFVTVNRQRITILGDDFYYRFPPNFIISLWERFKEFTA